MIILNQSWSHNVIDSERHYKTNPKLMNMYKNQTMLMKHALTITEIPFICSHKIWSPSTASNKITKPLRFLKKSITLHYSFLAQPKRVSLWYTISNENPQQNDMFHNPHFNHGQTTFLRFPYKTAILVIHPLTIQNSVW